MPQGKEEQEETVSTLDAIIEQAIQNEGGTQDILDGMVSVDAKGNVSYNGIGGGVDLGNVNYDIPSVPDQAEVQGPQMPTASASGSMASAVNANDIGGLAPGTMYADAAATSGVNYASGAKNKSAAAQIVEGYFDELTEDVSWFCKKFDYRYGDEPWYNSKDAVERAMKFLRCDLHHPPEKKKN